MAAEQGSLLTQKITVIDDLIANKFATPLRTSAVRGAPNVAGIMNMGNNTDYIQEFLLISKGGLADNAVIWVMPGSVEIATGNKAIERVVRTLTDRVPIVLEHGMPMEEIPGYLINDEALVFGSDRIRPLMQRHDDDVYLESSLVRARRALGPLNKGKKAKIEELIGKFPIP